MLTAVAPEQDRLREPASEPGDRRDRSRSDASTGSDRTETELESLDFDEFYTANRNEIGRALAFTLGNTTLGQEAVDEAMARAYQRWDEVRTYQRPAGWVYRTGLNWGRSSLRSMFRRRRRERLAADGAGTGPLPLTGVRIELIEALNTLSVDHRAVVVLRYYCDWSVTETATALNVAEGTVQSRCSRALDQLRSMLKDNDERSEGVGGVGHIPFGNYRNHERRSRDGAPVRSRGVGR